MMSQNVWQLFWSDRPAKLLPRVYLNAPQVVRAELWFLPVLIAIFFLTFVFYKSFLAGAFGLASFLYLMYCQNQALELMFPALYETDGDLIRDKRKEQHGLRYLLFREKLRALHPEISLDHLKSLQALHKQETNFRESGSAKNQPLLAFWIVLIGGTIASIFGVEDIWKYPISYVVLTLMVISGIYIWMFTELFKSQAYRDNEFALFISRFIHERENQ